MLCGDGTRGCHGWVEHNPNDAEWEGFHVRPWQDPAQFNVRYRYAWASLTADGKVEFEDDPRELEGWNLC